MAELSKLQIAALNQFAVDGFAGASMSHIASEAGIRKSSIYSHFASKEELFISLIRPVMEAEQSYLAEGINKNADQTKPLLDYLESFSKRINDSPRYLSFLLRAIYLPPEQLKEQVSLAGHWHYARLLEIVEVKITELGVAASEVQSLATAYIGIMDSVHTTVLYAPEASQQRLDSLWKLFLPALPGNKVP